MKKIIFIITSIFFLNLQLLPEETKPTLDCTNTIRPSFPAKIVRMNHIDSNQKVGDSLEAGQVAGTMTPIPSVVSKSFETQFRKAEQLYADKKFNEAVTVLEPTLNVEKRNPFLWNLYARALYAANRKKESFSAYKTLLSINDEDETYDEDGSPNIVIIDVWFLEAYWKISSIYLDQGEYAKSIFYNRKMLDIVTFANQQYNPNNMVYNVTALSYLAEAYYFLNLKEPNNYYACETLKLDPKNQYVLQFLLL
ncbi:tetratricopeptide repeat protein [Leptospira sp. WS39.C2]